MKGDLYCLDEDEMHVTVDVAKRHIHENFNANPTHLPASTPTFLE